MADELDAAAVVEPLLADLKARLDAAMSLGTTMFCRGDPVSKVGGDYRFDGVVVAAFAKASGAVRYVVEDDRGVLHIFSERNLRRREVLGDGPR